MFSIFRIRNLWMHLRFGTPKWEGWGRFAIMLRKLRFFFIFFTFFSELSAFYRTDFLSELNVRLWPRSPSLPTEGELNGWSIQAKERVISVWLVFVCFLMQLFLNNLNSIWDMLPFTVATVFGSITLFKLSLWTFGHLNSPISMYMIIYTMIQLAIYCSMSVLKQKASIYI